MKRKFTKLTQSDLLSALPIFSYSQLKSEALKIREKGEIPPKIIAKIQSDDTTFYDIRKGCKKYHKVNHKTNKVLQLFYVNLLDLTKSFSF